MLLCWQRSICQTYGFSSIHVRMRQLDHKEAGHQRTDAFKLWCCRRLLRVPWMARIKPVKLTRNLPWILIGRTDAEAEAPIILPPDAKSWLIGRDPDAEKDWGQEEKGATEDEMVGWHHRLSGHEFEQISGDSKGQGNLACCSSWGH